MSTEAKSKDKTNAETYESYKGYIRGSNDPQTLKIMAAIPPSTKVTFLSKLVALWAGRYSRRKEAIDHRGLSGTTHAGLGDTIAKDILVARTHSRNALYSTLPDLPPDQIGFAETIFVKRRLDVTCFLDIPNYGPSFLSLWTDAKNQGLSDEEAAQSILRWSCYEPSGWKLDDERQAKKLPVLDRKVKARLDQVVSWRQTGDLFLPWDAAIDGQHWQVRINDFPDEYMYSLLIDGTEAGDFHDWPQAWDRSEAKAETKQPEPAMRVYLPPMIAPATLLIRYQNGEHEAVWRDLVALGPDVRKPAYEKAAQSVATEMVRRAKYNFELLVERLKELDYQFHDGMYREPSTQEDLEAIAACEREGLWIPVSLRTFIQEMGAVSLVGTHPVLSPAESGIETDPLDFAGAFDLKGTLEHWVSVHSEERQTVSFDVGPDASAKVGILDGYQADTWYSIQLPNAAADAVLEGEPGNRTFVEHLRWSFQWGGLPGWEKQGSRPEKELAFLREGLLPL